MKKKGIITTIVVMALVAALIVGIFLYLGNQGKRKADSGLPTEKERLLEKDLDTEYPATPREVLKLYSRIMKCLFGEDMEEADFVKLAEMLNALYDEELLANNPKEELFSRLRAEVDEYKEAKKEIADCLVQDSRDAEKKLIDGRECTNLRASYLIWEKGNYEKTYEEFTLRTDADGKWKILGWVQTGPEETEGE